MTQHSSSFMNTTQQPLESMQVEQFEQVVKAILEGKYSWACVLILRFAGYNPAHYIPYRTYKRLIKDNKKLRMAESGISEGSNTNRDSISKERWDMSPNRTYSSTGFVK